MPTFYISFTDGDDTRTSVQAQDPSTPWQYPPSDLCDQSTSNSDAYTPVSGDVFKFKRGDTWWDVYFLFVYNTSNLTFTTYYDSITGDDDPSQPLPIWNVARDLIGSPGTWSNVGTPDTNIWSRIIGTSNNGVYRDKGELEMYLGDQLVADDFVDSAVNNEWYIPWPAKPQWVAPGGGFGTFSAHYAEQVDNDMGNLAVGEWTWDTTNSRIYVKFHATYDPDTVDSDQGLVLHAYTLSDERPFYHESVASGTTYVYSVGDPATVYSNLNFITQGALDTVRTGAGTFRRHSSGVVLVDSTDIVFDGLAFTGAEDQAVYIYNGAAATTAARLTFVNCDLSNYFHSVQLENVHATYSIPDIKFISCKVHRQWGSERNMVGRGNAEPGADGFDLLGGCSNMQIAHCDFQNWGHTCIGMYTTNAPQENLVMEYNIFRNGTSNYCRACGTAAAAEGKCVNWTFRYNQDLTNQTSKFSGNSTKVYNNLFDNYHPEVSGYYNTGGTTKQISTLSERGVIIFSDTGWVCKDIQFYNNIVQNCPGPAIFMQNQNDTAFGPVYIYNNVFRDTGWDTNLGVDRICVRWDYTQTGTFTEPKLFNNLFWNNGEPSGATNGDVYLTDSTASNVYYTVSELNASSWAHGGGNVDADPLLDDNFFPASTSPCLNAGAAPLSKYDVYNRPNWGNHIGAVWPRINTSKTRRVL